jgi:hypothetical protein
VLAGFRSCEGDDKDVFDRFVARSRSELIVVAVLKGCISLGAIAIEEAVCLARISDESEASSFEEEREEEEA